MERPHRPGRDRDTFRDRDSFREPFRDNFRGRADREFDRQPPRRPSRFSDGPVPHPPPDHRRSPVGYNHDGFPSHRRAFESPPRLPHRDYRPGSGDPPPPDELWPVRGGSRIDAGGDYRPVRRPSPQEELWPVRGGGGGPGSDFTRGDYRPVLAGGPSDELPPMRGGSGPRSDVVRGDYRLVHGGPPDELPPMRGGEPRGEVVRGDYRLGPGGPPDELPPMRGGGGEPRGEFARGDYRFVPSRGPDDLQPMRGGGSVPQGDVGRGDYRFVPGSAPHDDLPSIRGGGGGPRSDVALGDYRFVPGSGPPDELPPMRGSGGGGPQSDVASGNYRPVPGGGPPDGLWPMRDGPISDAGGYGPPPPQRTPMQHPPPPPPQLSGQKRGFPYPGHGDSSAVLERSDGMSYVKLFVGSVPKTATEDEIRPLFEEQGKVLEVALIKDKRTGQQQGCCFIKYATSEEADRAIKALHNQYTVPGGVGPVQVRYADGERERLGNGAVEYKLFVGSLNKLAAEKEVEEIFVQYGRIEDVYLMRDERRQSRGCGFVKFSNKDSAMAAISALNGIFTMRGCDQPLIVRFADPKRPRAGEPRAGPASGGPGFGSSPSPGIRLTSGPSFPGPTGGQGPTNAWQPMSPQNLGPPPNVGIHGLDYQLPSRSGEAAISSIPGGNVGPQGGTAGGSFIGSVAAHSTSPKIFNQPFAQVPFSGQQISPMQKPLQSPQHFPPAIQLHQGLGSAPTSQASMRPANQLQSGGQAPYGQSFSLQQPQSLPGQSPAAQFQVQQGAPSGVSQLRPTTAPSLTNSQLSAPASQQPPPYQKPPSHLTQMLSQQTQTLQASFQSSQQAFSQLQKEMQMMQPSTPNQPLQQGFQASKQQSQWAGAIPNTAANAPIAPTPVATSTSSAPSAVAMAASVKCNWTEHTSPDGYKYYHNSATGESRWVKPEELALYEQQQKMATKQPQPQAQPSVQSFANQQVTQTQPQLQPHGQFHNSEHLQYPPLLSMYPAPRGSGNQVAQEKAYTQSSGPANAVSTPARFQQGIPTAQDWAWKNNSGGR